MDEKGKNNLCFPNRGLTRLESLNEVSVKE